ncbi:MAG: M4 family metallopeptidase, partial [Saprospiraceae bacterium]|nr:M4 family metallopeptidase [Saprospiraceae bacterium]
MTKRSAHFSLVLSLLFTVQLFAQLERKYPSGDIDMSQHSIQPIRLQKMQFNKPHESQEHPIQSYRTLSGGLLTMNSDLQVTSKRIPTTNNPSIWSTGRFISSSASRKYTGVERTEIFLSEAIKRYNLDISMDVLHLVDVRHHPRTRRSRYQYRIGGIPVWGSEITVHTQASQFHLTGTLHPLPPTDNLVPVLTKDDTWEIIEQDLARASIRITGASRKKQHEHLFGEDVIELVLFPNKESLELVWHVSIHPNLASRWEYFVDAIDGQIIQKYESLCKLHDPPLVDGKSEGNGIDLNGTARTLQTWQVGAVHILMDASQGMFRPDLSNMPEDPVGVILTLDAENTFPGSDDFTFRDLISNSTAWSNPVAVSAHTNAEEAFSYFENTFERISINGQGGNIFSLINVVDEEGQDMDNAFWNGVAIFYGKGKQAFTSPLARSLDVAAHELAHGVIQTTANLTYQGESGALNESFADVFATMIDRSNWQIGEDIVNTTIFRTGALRDLSNPHNGGSRVGDPGYQPQVYTERFTGREDNGGVHINSGIPNHAFFLFAQSVGKDVAEQIYYTVLDEYLTKSSQFVDLRIAVVTESRLRFGENSSVHNAAKAAFDAVGILGETGGNYTEDVEENPGEDFILVTDEDFSAIRLIDETGQSLASDPITTVGPLSRPSVTDDGEIMVYVAQDKTIQYIQFDWEAREFSRGVLEENPIWHNAAISKDG